MIVSSVTGLLKLYAVGSQEQRSWPFVSLCGLLILSLTPFVFSATSGGTTNGHPVVLSFERDKAIKVTV